MPNTDADVIVQKVQSQLDTHGRNAEGHAYTTLLDELRQYKEGNHCTAETQALNNQLESSGILPKVAVGWLQNDFDKINTNKDDFGITKDEVSNFTSGNGDVKSDLDAMLANQLLSPGDRGRDQFDDLAKRNWLGADPDSIEKMDLRAYDRQDTRHRNREERHAGVRDDAAPLFEGSPPLMAILDASHNGECDGRVSERDMRRFLTAYEVNNKTENAGTGPYTPENAQYVSDLLDGKYPELTGENFTGFSARALARRAGLDHVKINSIDDYDQLVQVYADKTGKNDPPPEATKPTNPNDGCTVDEVPAAVDHTQAYSQFDDLSHYRKGEGQWHVAKRLLNAGNEEGDSAASNKDIWQLTMGITAIDGTKSLDAKGRTHPIVHPGDDAPVLGNIDQLFATNPKLAESFHKLEKKNAAAAAAKKTDSSGQDPEEVYCGD
ncbi:MAG: hypothetical protein HYX67_00430 [Candidatus Melainabacteria bacterium]|nr:hypothetical protein [Candidatus Melainabacteria bacterium]